MRVAIKHRIGELEGRRVGSNLRLAQTLAADISFIYGEEGEEEPEIRTERDAQAFLQNLKDEIVAGYGG